MNTKSRKAYELSITAKRNTGFKKERITCSNDCYFYAKQFYFDDINIYESSFIVLLNNNMETLGYVKLSTGGITETAVDVRIVAKYAIECLATAVILVHNHPSRNLKPSKHDDNITNQVLIGLKTLRITLADHIIITEDDYYSYKDNGKL